MMKWPWADLQEKNYLQPNTVFWGDRLGSKNCNGRSQWGLNSLGNRGLE
ncbi:hypothetical protein SYNPCC7002_A2871 [Picosynechococcus sp. PCC 7002]|nr:hypothetical protein SYNPCC7002_A2871 [Picosynechococcus sp. PCC 7002]